MPVGNVSFKGFEIPAHAAINPRAWAKDFLEEQELKTELMTHMTKPIKFLDKMKNFVGEVPNIIINALGTGLVAPIFIKHNFLSKTDEDTRTYSAWRQPVSAVLAVLTQAGMVIPFNKVVDNMTNRGDFIFRPQLYNKIAHQDLSYLERTIKKANPNLSREAVVELAKAQQYEQFEDLIEGLYRRNRVEYTANGEKIELKNSNAKDLMEQTTQDMLSKAKEGSKEEQILKEMIEKIESGKTVAEVAEHSKGILKEGQFVYQVAEKHILNTSAHIKGMKQMTGLVVSLAILPFTCCLLNYLYPKFMNVFFPELSSKKSKQKQNLQPMQDVYVGHHADAPTEKTQEVRK